MLMYIELGPSAVIEPERYGMATFERLRYGRGLFDESSHPRDSSGEFTSGGGHASAAIADEPFGLTSGPKPKARTGKGKSSDSQGSLFDTDLHGQEARDLPGQTNFLGKAKEQPKPGSPGPARDMGGWGYGSTNIAITPKRQELLERLKAADKLLGSGGGYRPAVISAFNGNERQAESYLRMRSGGSDILASAAHADGWHSNPGGEDQPDLDKMSGIDKSDAPSRKPAVAWNGSADFTKENAEALSKHLKTTDDPKVRGLMSQYRSSRKRQDRVSAMKQLTAALGIGTDPSLVDWALGSQFDAA